jgi:hypothetical protein
MCACLPVLRVQAEGSVVAFYSPRFANKGPGGTTAASSSGGLAVSQASQVERLASSAGWGFCRGTTKAGATHVSSGVGCDCVWWLVTSSDRRTGLMLYYRACSHMRCVLRQTCK